MSYIKSGWDHKPNGWEEEDIDNINPHRYTLSVDSSLLDNVNYDAIFVLAGGLQDNNDIHEWVKRRLDVAHNLYKQGTKIICLGGGTYHKSPKLNDSGYVIHESTACADYLIKLGIDYKDIYKEWGSYDTIANGYFAFTNFIYPMGIKCALIITSEFHMERAKRIFNWIKDISGFNYKLNYKYVTDYGLDKDMIDCRILREKDSINKLNSLIRNISTLPDFVRWFYEEHKAYSSDTNTDRIALSDDIKRSY